MNLSEIRSVLTASKIHLSNNLKNDTSDYLLSELVDMTESLLNLAEGELRPSSAKYRVVGYHPILARQDKTFTTKVEADIEAHLLQKYGYDVRRAFVNVPKPKIKPPMDLALATEYEIYGTWWSGLIPKFMSNFVADCFIAKARRKLTRFLYHKVLKLTSQPPSTDCPKAPTSG